MKKSKYKVYLIIFLNLLLRYSYSQTWSEQVVPPNTPALYSVNAVNSNVCWASGDNGCVLYTSDGGITWINRSNTIFLGNRINVICGIDSVTADCTITINQTAVSIIFRSTDKGVSWLPVYNQMNGNIRDIKMSANNVIGYAYGDPVGGIWTFLRTTDRGATFSAVGPVLSQSGNEHGNYRAMAVSQLFVFLGTSNNKIHRFTILAPTWISSASQYLNTYAVGFDLAGLNGLSGGNPSSLSNSINSGLLWILQAGLPGSGDCNTIGNIDLQFWYARGPNIYYSNDLLGLIFNQQYICPNNGTYEQMSFTNIQGQDNIESTIRGWGVTNNGSLSVYNGQLSEIKKIKQEIPSEYKLSQNFPNPFNPSTSIEYSLKGSGNITLRVFNAEGKLITTLFSGYLTAGSYKISWEAAGFSSGVYFYKLSSGSFTESRKMLLIK